GDPFQSTLDGDRMVFLRPRPTPLNREPGRARRGFPLAPPPHPPKHEPESIKPLGQACEPRPSECGVLPRPPVVLRSRERSRHRVQIRARGRLAPPTSNDSARAVSRRIPSTSLSADAKLAHQ